MGEFLFSSSRIIGLAVLEYTVSIKPPDSGFDKDQVEIENAVLGIIEDSFLPKLSTQGVSSGRVEERGVPPEMQELSVIVDTVNAKTSKYSLNEIEKEVNQEISGEVTMIAVRAVPTNRVRQIVNRLRD
jgi:hypothetical protein